MTDEKNGNKKEGQDTIGTGATADTTKEKYTGGLRIKAENMVKINLNGATIPAFMICYVSRGGRNIARIYTHPDDVAVKIKELKEEDRFFVTYRMVLNETERYGEDMQGSGGLSDEGTPPNNNLFGTNTNGNNTLN